MGGNSAHRDYLVGSGEIVRVDRREDGEGVVRGTLAAGKADSGGSWDLTGCIEVRVSIFAVSSGFRTHSNTRCT
jgi:hypothetical protein